MVLLLMFFKHNIILVEVFSELFSVLSDFQENAYILIFLSRNPYSFTRFSKNLLIPIIFHGML